MEICILASGSKGNCIYIAGGGTALLIDAGLSAKETLRRLEIAGIEKNDIKSIIFTHDHTDHCKGARVLSKKLEAELYANDCTQEIMKLKDKKLEEIEFNTFDSANSFSIRNLNIEPFTVPHDAGDSVGFVLDDGKARIGIVTDIGFPTILVKEKLRGCDMIIIESNHDVQLLRQSDRPQSLIQRILGRSGHLSNEAAAEVITETASAKLKHIALFHLSEDCNSPRLARETAIEALNDIKLGDIRVHVASQYEVSELIQI